MNTDSDIVLYEYWRSSTSYRARIALNLKNLRYRSVTVDLAENQHHAEAHRARDPLGRVPVLCVDGLTLTQSFAILEYLEEAHPSPPLLPPTPVARARVRALSFVIVADIHPLGNPSTMAHAAALPGVAAFDKAAWQRHFIAQGLRAFEAMLAHADTGKFCHGDHPTFADCCLLPQLYNARRWQLPLDAYPRIRAIEQAAGELDAFQKAHPEAVRPRPSFSNDRQIRSA